MKRHETDDERQNEAGTGTPADTGLTQPRSGFDLEDIRRQLIALRVKHGANTPIGYRCSNLVEMLQNYRDAKGGQRTALAAMIDHGLTKLHGLVRDAA